jgi:hypothetical protein
VIFTLFSLFLLTLEISVSGQKILNLFFVSEQKIMPFVSSGLRQVVLYLFAVFMKKCLKLLIRMGSSE